MATRPPKPTNAKSKAAAAPAAKPAKAPAKKVAAEPSVPMRTQMKAPSKKPVVEKTPRKSAAELHVETIKRQQIPTLVVGDRGRITLPAEVREKLGLDAGSLLLLVVHKQGYLELIPATAVPRDQLYFYRPDVQEGIDESIIDRAEGRDETITFSSQADVTDYFARIRKEREDECRDVVS